MKLNEQWCKFLEEEERYWRICLEVARANPHLCAEEVELQAVDVMLGLKPEPKGKELV